MNPREVLEYYSREDVQKAIIEIGRDREVVGVFRKGGFGERPNVVLYPKDISSMVRNGVVEFHCSLERWTNPMSIRHDNHEALRSGWDIILDIDGKGWEHSKLAAKLLCDALKGHGINSFFIKYTGGKGFHLGIPWESLP
jgi:DNA primase